MSETFVRDSYVDSYKTLSSYTNNQSQSEKSIVQALVKGSLTKTTNDTYISPVNSTSWNYKDLKNDSVNNSAIFNSPNGTVTECSVISVDLSQNDVSFNTYSTNISSLDYSNNTYSFSSLNTSAPYYDSNYVVTQSIEPSVNDVSGNVLFTFDMSNSNLKIQNAMQSRWNTTQGPYADLSVIGGDPLTVSEDVSFNTEKSFGRMGTAVDDVAGEEYKSYWANVDTNSVVNFYEIAAPYQLVNNGLYVKDRDNSDLDISLNTDIGVFRLQQGNITITTKVNENSISGDILENMPLFNGNTIDISAGTVRDNSFNIPGNMTEEQFKTLLLDLNQVSNGWKFNIDVSSNGGGYFITNSSQGFVTDLSNSNIKDNLFYMENYARNNHHIDISNGIITIDPSLNALADTANLIEIDLTDGETLTENNALLDGEIKLNLNDSSTRVTDVSGNIADTFGGYVYYESDALENTFLDEDSLNSNKFNVMWQKVVQNTDETSVNTTEPYIVQHNNATLNLYTNKLANNVYNSGDFELSFNPSNMPDISFNDTNLWKIDLENNINAENKTFYTDEEYTIPASLTSTGSVTNVTQEEIYNNNYRLKLTSKKVEDISLYNSVNAVGCGISYQNGENYLTTKTSSAFNSLQGRMPLYSDNLTKSIRDGTDIDISYSYTYKTVSSTVGQTFSQDYIQVYYEPVDSSGISQNVIETSTGNFKIIDENIKTTSSTPSTDYAVVPSEQYTVTDPSFILHKVVTTTILDVEFDPKFALYSNLLLSMDNITHKTTFYVLKNGDVELDHDQLNEVTLIGSGVTDIGDALSKYVDTVERENGVRISGVLTNNDLRPFSGVVESTDNSDTWQEVSPSFHIDIYYKLQNTQTLNAGGTVNLINEFTGGSDKDKQLNLEYYYTPFTIDKEPIIKVYSYEQDAENIATSTTLSSNTFNDKKNYLTVRDNYASVNTWVDGKYDAVLEKVDSTSYTISVKNEDDVVMFTINSPNSTVFLGDFLVSHIKGDIYRAQKDLDDAFSENFGVATYANGAFDLSGILGVYVSNDANDYTTIDAPVLGVYQHFRVLGDSVKIAEFGTADLSFNELGNVNFNSGSLIFKYSVGDEYSAGFTLPHYRGYKGVQTQTYIIKRTQSSANFIIDSTDVEYPVLSNNLTNNMYYNQAFIVDNLVNDVNVKCADLNISSSFKYSILPDGNDTSYTVNVVGDYVNLTINKPNFSNIDISMSLLEYGDDNVFSFDDNWYLTTKPMLIRPSRVKLTNEDYILDTLNYNFVYETTDSTLFKSVTNRWLGNPQILDTQDPETAPSSDKWETLRYFSEEDLRTGFNIGSKHIYLPVGRFSNLKIAYFVSLPPYYIFEQMSTKDSPTIPYNYSVDDATIRYYPYTGLTTTFNPFSEDLSFNDINDVSVQIDNDAEYLNDVTFEFKKKILTLTNLYTDTNEERVSAVVTGTNIKIDLYNGLYPSIETGTHNNPIYDGPITSITDVPDIDSTAILFRDRADDGAISFSLLQYPKDVGYPNNDAASYKEILKTDVVSDFYNIDMKIGNSSWFNDNSGVTFFDMVGTGVKPTLYTVTDMNDPITQINYRRIFKYSSQLAYNVNSSPPNDIQTITLPFVSREYYDQQLSGATFSSGIWNYSTILEQTDISPDTISWTADPSFNSNAYVGWSFGNPNVSQDIIQDFLYVQDVQRKWTFIKLDNFVTYKNQFGLPVSSLSWDGTMTTPLINTRAINLHPSIKNPNLSKSDNSTIQQYSNSTLSGAEISD